MTVNNEILNGDYLLFVIFFPAHVILFFLCFPPDFFDAQQAERSICTMAVCAAWLWHLHRQPWVLQRGRLLSVGCSQPSGDSLHMESLSVSGDPKVGVWGGGLNLGGKGRLGVVLFFFRDRVRICNDSVLLLELRGHNMIRMIT